VQEGHLKQSSLICKTNCQANQADRCTSTFRHVPSLRQTGTVLSVVC